MILDSSFLIDLLAEDTGAVAKLEEIDDELLAVPTLVYTEVGVGLDGGSDGERRFEAAMDRMTLVPYDAEAARRAVDIQRTLRENGHPVGAVDAMIAGIALARDQPIVTRNADEFSRTPARISPY
ncbi:type II toxin-antitoxin system VapC family toxin [Haloplanus rubicundus]|uniref:Ribonuclease VapC n=1 Tax=Haloplanus rubicundus TaxID=1547898 RepID=A0A345E380_9EURY|nr:type II toxin-antitoxin system VapC family toxin [Haloplanus rubicundus]AXG06652.1 type II toxin-antitoxin system VapC family toxin [Haloplanus rubicundus]AXG10027.1 type II toxin-antitoxin system VapC family toxin [Haloplanus rubicundus]